MSIPGFEELERAYENQSYVPPGRNPYHPHALSFDDIKVGVNLLARSSEYEHEGPIWRGIVICEPSIRHKIGNSNWWTFQVVIVSPAGKPEIKEFYLSQWGVMPEESQDGKIRRWNSPLYLLLDDE